MSSWISYLTVATAYLTSKSIANEDPSSSINCIADDPGLECINAGNQAADKDVATEEYTTCGLYIARSTIPNSGLGVYSGVSQEVGSIIAPPEIAHQILCEFDDKSKTAQFDTYAKLAWDYLWQSYVTGGSSEGKAVESMIPGLGMAANSFLPLINSRSLMGKIDSAGVNLQDSMGAGSGAFSSYHNTMYVAEVPIHAGGEIFVDYGDNYFRGRPQHYGMIPLAPEFSIADTMLASLWAALKSTTNIKRLLNETDESIQKDLQILWDSIRNTFVDNERVRNALPSSIKDLPRASKHGTPTNFLRGDNPRSLEWLQSNGYCMDGLSVQKSKIPHAGRGAFAKRQFGVGETILPLPLIQIDRRALHVMKGGDMHSHQLLLNYCFGHKHSSLLLYPYSSTCNFINHGGKSANAKVVWAKYDKMDFHQEPWLMSSPKDVMGQKSTGLLMLVVATRDIAKDEEVLIDYGSDWQETWDAHANNWSSDYMQRSAAELNDSEIQLKTIFEGVYPIMTMCHYRYFANEDKHPNMDDESIEDDNDGPEEVKANLHLIEAQARIWQDLGGRKTMRGDHLRPCMILDRKPGDEEDTYLVQMFNQHQKVAADELPPQKHYVKGVPRRAILFVDSSHTSNMQNEKSFRHEIGFPDGSELWPEAWMDLE